MFKQVKVYIFDSIRQGDKITGFVNIRVASEIQVNPYYVTMIEKQELKDAAVLYYVRLCKQSVPGQHDFYTDYEGMKTLTNT